MNKNKMIMAAIGGVALVVVLAFGTLAVLAHSEVKAKRAETRENVEQIEEMMNAKIAPTMESVKDLQRNARVYDAWRTNTLAELVRGDVALDRNSSGMAFKSAMIEDARALAKLPGGVQGRIVAENFDFGFKSYISESAVPSAAGLGALKRQWAEVKEMVRLLAQSGVVEIKSIEPPKPAEAAKAPAPERKPARRGKQPAEAEKPVYEEFEYTLVFTARPLALVKALNAFADAPHITFVRGLSFERESDMLRDMLGGGKKKDEAGPGRRRRRAKAVEEKPEEGEEVARKGLVTDPQIEAPFVVTLKVATVDFGTNGAAAAAGKTDEDKEDEE